MEKFCWLSFLLTIVWIMLISGISNQDDTTYMINNTLTTQCYKATVFSPYCKNRRILHHSSHHHASHSGTDSGGTDTSRSGISNTNYQQPYYMTANQIGTKQSITAGTVIILYQLHHFEKATLQTNMNFCYILYNYSSTQEYGVSTCSNNTIYFANILKDLSLLVLASYILLFILFIVCFIQKRNIHLL